MAGGIRTPSFLSAIDTDPYPYPHEKEGYCQQCINAGVKSPLQKRMYRFNEKTKQVEIITDSDQEKFRQCYNCGDVVPVYEVKLEPKIEDFIETSDNPFDSIKSDTMTTLRQTSSQSLKNKYNPIKRQYKQKRDQIDSEKDPEIQQMLFNGAEIIEDRSS